MGKTRSTMAMSGIQPDPTCEEKYKDVKAGAKTGTRAWTFKFNDKRTSIVPADQVPRTGDFKADFENLKELVPAKDGMYIIYDFEYQDTKSGYNDGDSIPTKCKLILLTWAPDNAKPAVK